VLVIQDITRLRRLETMRTDFVANVSHELRTPVTIIRANAETLLSGPADALQPTEVGFLEAIERNAIRLTNLISDLLEISRFESGSFKLDLKPLSAADVLSSAVNAVTPLAEERGAVLERLGELSGVVRGDRQALEQVLINLLQNAVKYGGGRVQLRIDARAGIVRFEIEDSGEGIEARFHDRIFERFFRADAGRSKAIGGTGLGLSIVKHLVNAMDGSVGVRAAEPKGSVFWVELPAEPLAGSPEGQEG